MSSSSEDPAQDQEDAEFAEILRAVAKPPELAKALVDQIVVPSTLDMPPGMLRATSTDEQEPAPGEVLDERYRIERVLGRGGMGVVFAAKNLRTGKLVAIKWMALTQRGSPALASLTERFRREARAAASIRHPNVVDVYDVGGPHDAPFLVMELLEGESLREAIARGPLSVAEAARIMQGVLRGVLAAHRAGIVHRDLKPDNIFLCRAPDSSEPIPKVLDFGVAAMRHDHAEGPQTLTRSGAIVGTPAYMALEQLTGKAVDARTDVYALGVVFYEMLTGRLPFEARSASELAVMQATEHPTPLSARRPELRGTVEQIILKALQREPHDRYATVDELAKALEPLTGQSSQGMIAERSSASRNLSLAVLALLTVVAALAWFVGRDTEPRSIANEPAPAAARSTSAPKPSSLPKGTLQPMPAVPPPIAGEHGADPSIVEDLQPAPALPTPARAARKPAKTPRKPIERARPVEPEAVPTPAELKQPAVPAATKLRLDDF